MKEYLRTTRSAWHAYLFVLPLLALYQAMVLLANVGTSRPVVNGADALLQELLQLAGLGGWLGSWIALTAGAGIIIYLADRDSRRPLRLGYFPLLLAESAVYALLLGTVVATLTSFVLPGLSLLQIGGGALHIGQRLAVSLGAGLYEELVFRLLLTGGLMWVFARIAGRRGTGDGSLTGPALLAVFISSLVFSLFHYIGPFGEPFRVSTFTFRFIAGMVLSGLFTLRGFAVVAWTHALYDVFLVLAGQA